MEVIVSYIRQYIHNEDHRIESIQSATSTCTYQIVNQYKEIRTVRQMIKLHHPPYLITEHQANIKTTYVMHCKFGDLWDKLNSVIVIVICTTLFIRNAI